VSKRRGRETDVRCVAVPVLVGILVVKFRRIAVRLASKVIVRATEVIFTYDGRPSEPFAPINQNGQILQGSIE
jgi:hypothetical protein